MHAYDAATLRGARRLAAAGRAGGHPRRRGARAHGETVAIADAEGAIGLAGVMGGASTEAGAATRTSVEADWDRRGPPTRRALGMSTEASHRFERAIDRWGGGDAMRRCIELVLAMAAASSPTPARPLARAVAPATHLPPARAGDPGARRRAALERHRAIPRGHRRHCVSKPDDGRIAVDVPGWRPDLVREIDLIEEIARLQGYDTFPSDLRPFRMGTLADAADAATVTSVRQGLVEARTLRSLPAPAGLRRRERERQAPQPAVGGRCVAAAAAAAWPGPAGRRQLGQPRGGRATVRDRDRVRRGRARPSAAGRAAGGRGADREAGAGALDRHRRGPLRPLGPEGPVRGRGRPGDSRGGGAS